MNTGNKGEIMSDYKTIKQHGYDLNIVRQQYSCFHLYLIKNHKKIHTIKFYSRGLKSPMYEKLANGSNAELNKATSEMLKRILSKQVKATCKHSYLR